jgi:hypothetical protein
MMAESEIATSAVYREHDSGKFRVKASSNVAAADDYAGTANFADVAAQFNLANTILAASGINPAVGEDMAVTALQYTTPVWLEAVTGKIRVADATNNPATATAGSATFSTLRASINAMLAQLSAAGINPSGAEDLSLTEHLYDISVYREQNTGKVRFKGATNVADLVASPTNPEDAAAKFNDVLDLITAVGLNPDA